MRKGLSYISLLFLLLLISCKVEVKEQSSSKYIQEEDSVLRVGMVSRSGSYFTLRDNRAMGFEYELSKQLADDLGKQLEVVVARDVDGLISLLDSGVPLIAFPLTITESRKQKVDYSDYEFISHQVIVQPKKRNGQVRDVLDLIGKKVTVVKDSKYHHRLQNLNDEIGGGIEIGTLPSEEYDEDKLIRMVSEGKLDMTVADNDVAKLSRRYYKNIDVTLEISHPQRCAWAVAKGDTAMLGVVNSFFSGNGGLIQKLRDKYYEPSGGSSSVVSNSKVPTFIDDTTICVWDSMFIRQAKDTPWDWRLLAAIAYSESRFNPNAGSFAGARGLMQLLPETMIRLGADEKTMLEPEENIRIAVLYLNRMRELITTAQTENDRIRLVLAAYNAGLGHIRDAQRLCETHGHNPSVWVEVERYIRMLSSSDYYSLPDVKHGYLRGDETADYVNDIMQLYSMYKKKFKK